VLTVARFPVSRRRGCGQVVDAGEVLVRSGRRRCHDDDQGDTAGSKTWSASSIASSCDSEDRLETCRAAGALGS
jgi:hypothetical protein